MDLMIDQRSCQLAGCINGRVTIRKRSSRDIVTWLWKEETMDCPVCKAKEDLKENEYGPDRHCDEDEPSGRV